MLNMTYLLIVLVVGILAAVVIWLGVRRGGAPVLRTYSVSGDIILVNDCSGNGADNPAAIDITVKLFYTDHATIPGMRKVESVAMVLQADGITSKGTYAVSDVPTNKTGDRWEIDFPNECLTLAPCAVGETCTNGATNGRQPIAIAGVNSTYDYRYSCSCVR